MRAPKIDARQTFGWVPVADLEMAPDPWGRAIRTNDAKAIARAFDPDMIGALAVWFRPNLDAGKGRYIIIDGQHRCAALRIMGYDDQSAPCLLYEGLTVETAAELSLGLQERRNLHPFDRHRAALSAHDRRAIEIDKILQHLGLRLVHSMRANESGHVSAVTTLGLVWDRMSGAGLERVLTVCGDAWERTAPAYGANTLKLVMVLLASHNGAVDDERLVRTLAKRSPAQWLSATVTPRRSISSVAQDVVIEYNRTARGQYRLPELTPGQYEVASRRRPVPKVRGTVDARTMPGASRSTRERR